MSTLRAGEQYRFAVHLLDKSNARLTGASPDLVIQFIKAGDPETGRFWNGSIWAASPTNLAMVEIDATNQKGSYDYPFTLRAGDHRSDGAHYLMTVDAGPAALNRYHPVLVEPEPSIGDELMAAVEGDMGTTLAAHGTLKRLVQEIGAYCAGSRRVITSGNRDFEECLGPDRATVYLTREAQPVGGPYTTLKRNGDHTIRLPAAVLEFAPQQLFTAAGVELPAAVLEFVPQIPTTDVQLPAAVLEFVGKDPNVQWL